MRTRIFQIVVMVGALILAAWIAVTHVRHWGDWVVLGVLIMTFFGAAIAIYPRRYTAKKRTFVRTTKPPR
ncbi:MAG: hypothetical protein ACR2JH_09200 [Solirubrobacteraceae bacterium]